MSFEVHQCVREDIIPWKEREEQWRLSTFIIIPRFHSGVEIEMQTDSECESDVSSIADSSSTPPIFNREHFVKRLDSLNQENRVLKVELETYKLRLKASQQEIKQLKQSVSLLSLSPLV